VQLCLSPGCGPHVGPVIGILAPPVVGTLMLPFVGLLALVGVGMLAAPEGLEAPIRVGIKPLPVALLMVGATTLLLALVTSIKKQRIKGKIKVVSFTADEGVAYHWCYSCGPLEWKRSHPLL
jgi:hypothetical protein